MEYRCYFLGPDGRIVSRREFEARDNQEAQWLAAELYALYAECAESHHGWELWQRRQLVISVPEHVPAQQQPFDLPNGAAS